MNEPKNRIYDFGGFRLDPGKRLLLRREGDSVPLTPKVFDTLLYLVEHSGQLLDKDELMAAVWPDTVVEESNLSQNVYTLRRVLGEGRADHHYSVTVPGHGYKFVADVTTVADVTGPDGAESEPSESLAEVLSTYPRGNDRHGIGLRTRGWHVLFVGALAAALAVGGFYLWRSRAKTDGGARVRTLIALPFKPLVPENRDEALELGMADTLIAKLSNMRDVTVRPISAVRRYDGLEQDPVAAGRELGVEAVLDGTIQRWGDRIRVTARLVRVGDSRTLWAGQFDRKFTDIFEVQDAIADKVVRELFPRLAGEDRERLAKRYTDDTEAYELYLKGRFFMSLAQPRKAIEFFEQAVRRDPNCALAYAGLADIYSRLPIATDTPSNEAIPRAKAAVLKALEIDSRLAEAYTALGWIKFWYEWDWAGSEADHRLALEINHHNFSAHLGYAHLLSNTGRHEEALREVDQALGLDSLSPLANALKGQFLFEARRYSEAVEQLRKTLEIEPNFWITQLLLGTVYEREGRYNETLEAARKARALSGATSSAIALRGYTYAVSGRREEAESALQELQAISKERYVPPYSVALVYHGLRNSDETLRWLGRAYEERDVRMVFLGVDPKWDSLRGEPRFTRLLERMKLLK